MHTCFRTASRSHVSQSGKAPIAEKLQLAAAAAGVEHYAAASLSGCSFSLLRLPTRLSAHSCRTNASRQARRASVVKLARSCAGLSAESQNAHAMQLIAPRIDQRLLSRLDNFRHRDNPDTLRSRERFRCCWRPLSSRISSIRLQAQSHARRCVRSCSTLAAAAEFTQRALVLR